MSVPPQNAAPVDDSPAHSVRSALPVTRHDRWIALAVWLFFTGFYGLTLSGTIDTPDGVMMFQVTESVLDHGHLHVTPFPGWEDFGGKFQRDRQSGERHFYSWFGIGESLAAVPTYLIGRALAPLAQPAERGLLDFNDPNKVMQLRLGEGVYDPVVPVSMHPHWYDADGPHFARAFVAYAASWTNCWVAALVLVFLYLAARELGHSRSAALVVVAASGFASPLWPYAKTFFGEPLSAAGLAGFLYAAIRSRRAAHAGVWWSLAGFGLGVTVLAKITHVGFLLPAVLWFWLDTRRRETRTRVRWLGCAALGWSLPVLVIAAYNHARFGAPWDTGYIGPVVSWNTPFLEGFFGFFLSPGRGMLWYFPLAPICAYAAWRHADSHKLENGFLAGCTAFLLLALSSWTQWEGGWCWGPRFLVPVIVLYPLALAPLVDDALPAAERVAASLFGLASAVVAFSGTLVNFAQYGQWLKMEYVAHMKSLRAAGVASDYDMARWDWAYAPLTQYWTFPLHDFYLLPKVWATPPGLFAGVFLGFLMLAVTGLVLLVHNLRRASAR